MTLSLRPRTEIPFLLTGLLASVALHAAFFLTRSSLPLTQPFALQPSDFSVEINLIETSAGQPEPILDPILTTPLASSETVAATPTPLSPSTPFSADESSPRLLPTPTPAQLSPSRPSATILARPNPSQNSAPHYPNLARQKGWEGTVLLRAEITPQGTVASLTLLQTSGHPLLDQAALTAVRQWRFHPSPTNHLPTASTVEIPVKFSLQR